MIAKNEEKSIERALSSIPDEYEKIVVDTGSTDKTVELAKQLCTNVHFFSWNDNFAAARNESILKATGDYILILDADEELRSDADYRIRQYIRQNPLQSGSVLLHNMMNGETNKHRMVRLFPNRPTFYYKGIVHEVLYENGEPANYIDTNIEINHYGYQSEEYLEKDKFNRYILLYHNHLESNPNDGYMLYQLGKLYFSTKDYQNALIVLEKCLHIKEEAFLYYPVMLVMLGYTLKNLNQSGIAEEILQNYFNKYPAFPDLPFLQGLLAMDTGKLNQIESYFLRAIEIGETSKYTSVTGVGSFKAEYNLGVYYEITGQKNKALLYYQSSANNNYQPALLRLNNLNFASIYSK